jgi:hypothetical protein
MMASKTAEIARLESVRDAVPKQREALTDKVQQLRAQRDDLIAASVAGDPDAGAKVRKLDEQIIATLQDSSRLDDTSREAHHLIQFKAIEAAGELAHQQLKALDKVESQLSAAIVGLAKAVNAIGVQQGFEQIENMARKTHNLTHYGRVSRQFAELLQESLHTGISHALAGREVGVDLSRARAALEELVEWLPEAEGKVKVDLENERNRARYERSRLDAVLAVTV